MLQLKDLALRRELLSHCCLGLGVWQELLSTIICRSVAAMPSQGPFGWADRLVAALLLIVGHESLAQSHLCQAEVASSFFSGIGTAELAWQVVGLALLAAGMPFKLRMVFACEISAGCREVLRDLPVAHIFGDIVSLLSVGTLNLDWDFQRKTQVMMSATAFVTGWCYKCGKYCPYFTSDIDTSGSPCQDWSSAGLGLGVEGKRIHLFLAWVRLHLIWETSVIIHENVTNFDIALLQYFMGSMYHIFCVDCGPEDVGFPWCRRLRRYVALVHKGKMRVLHNPEILFRRVCFHLQHLASVEDLFHADHEEVQAEVLSLARDRRMTVFMSGTFMARAVDPLARVVDPQSGQQVSMARAVVSGQQVSMARAVNPFSVLTQDERDHLRSYSQLWVERFGSDPAGHLGLVLNLGDNPAAGWITWSAPSSRQSTFCIPTLRRGWTVLWLPALMRWLTVRERLLMMGFPAYPNVADVYRLPSTFSLPWHIAKQTIGNGMHLANVGVWQAVVAASVIRK